MNIRLHNLILLAAIGVTLSACGGGGSSGSAPPPAGGAPPVANSAPKIDGLPASGSVAQDSSSDVIPFSVSDAETSSAKLVVAVESSNPELIAQEAIVLAGNADARTLLVTPAEGVSGSSTITVSATDEQGVSTRQSFDVSVTSEQRSFREMVGTAYARDEEDREGEQITGYSWVDNPEDDETAFDHLFAE